MTSAWLSGDGDHGGGKFRRPSTALPACKLKLSTFWPSYPASWFAIRRVASSGPQCPTVASLLVWWRAASRITPTHSRSPACSCCISWARFPPWMIRRHWCCSQPCSSCAQGVKRGQHFSPSSYLPAQSAQASPSYTVRGGQHRLKSAGGGGGQAVGPQRQSRPWGGHHRQARHWQRGCEKRRGSSLTGSSGDTWACQLCTGRRWRAVDFVTRGLSLRGWEEALPETVYQVG